MPDLTITVEGVSPVPFSVSPTLAFGLHIVNANAAEDIHTVVLRCQIQIEVTRRRYSGPDQEKLRDLFGEPERWGQTLRSMLWTHASAVVPPFKGTASVPLHVPCTFDFNVAATKYFAGLTDGEIPLCLMFSGTVFYENHAGAVQVAPISWDKETRFRLPLNIWKEMMDLYYPGSAWMCLRRDVFEQLQDYKVKHGIPTWEEAVERILAQPEVARV
jgi:hypothetical protein